jgi:hypothetical protein
VYNPERGTVGAKRTQRNQVALYNKRNRQVSKYIPTRGSYAGRVTGDVAITGAGATVGSMFGPEGTAMGSIPGAIMTLNDGIVQPLWDLARAPILKRFAATHNWMGIGEKYKYDPEQHKVVVKDDQGKQMLTLPAPKDASDGKKLDKRISDEATKQQRPPAKVQVIERNTQRVIHSCPSSCYMYHMKRRPGGRVALPVKKKKVTRSNLGKHSKKMPGMKRARVGKHMAVPRTGGLIAGEIKQIDTSHGGQIQAPGGSTQNGMQDPSDGHLIPITQGNAQNQRVGRAVTPISFEIQGCVTLPPLTTAYANSAELVPQYVKVALVWDTQTNGAQCTSEQIYKAIRQNPTDTAAPYAPREPEYMTRFQVLKQWTMVLSDEACIADGSNLRSNGAKQGFSFFTKKRLHQMKFIDTAGAIANVADNSLHLVAFADNDDVTRLCSIEYCARTNYIDH